MMNPNNDNNNKNKSTILFYLAILCGIIVFLLTPSTLATPVPVPPPPEGVPNELNNVPILGFLVQPRDYSQKTEHFAHKYYLAASYVKFIESAGGRAVPITWKIKSFEHALELLSPLNGLVLPGGDSEWEAGIGHLLDAAVALNKKQPFPIIGICQGFQQLMQYFSGNPAILGYYRMMNEPLALDFTVEAKKTRFFNAMSPELKQLFADKRHNVTMNFHNLSVGIADFKDPKSGLSDHFHLIATNVDEDGQTHVSVVEHKTLPIFGFQYHPEKSSFEFGRTTCGRFKSKIPHTIEAILAQQFTANFLVQFARFNNNTFPSVHAEEAALIYHHPRQKEGGSFVEQYYFYYP